jgi:hypothetical protein
MASAALAGGCGPHAHASWWQSDERPPWPAEASSNALAIVVYGALIAVGAVVQAGIELGRKISAKWQDGAGGVSWDSPEGRQLRRGWSPPGPSSSLPGPRPLELDVPPSAATGDHA